jgi:hypothetical protein
MCAVALIVFSACVSGTDGDLPTDDYHGAPQTTAFTGPPPAGNPFFASLGTNGRTCGSCHIADQGWTITPGAVQARFNATGGTDPIFHNNDGTVSPNADTSTVSKRRVAYGMLLSKGLIRVGIGIPANAEFTLVAVDDPYHFASASQLSLFRRPLPSTNLGFLSTIMWDGREASLGSQATDATLGHAQATGTVQSQMDSIVDFESSIFTAQIDGGKAGRLDLSGGHGGPWTLSDTTFYIGINDPLGHNPTGAPFNPNAFTLFDNWNHGAGNGAPGWARQAIYRGQQLFNTLPITITNVAGLNDTLGMPSIQGTCTTCHDTPNVGNHSVGLPLNIGISDAGRRTPDMPLYTLQNTTTGATVQTTDPGKALISGKWSDISKFKGPILRGVGMRAPYFHNGSAATLDDVVDFYDSRFALGLTSQQHDDLVAFLGAL